MRAGMNIVVSLEDWQGFEEVQTCLTACASPLRGSLLAIMDDKTGYLYEISV